MNQFLNQFVHEQLLSGLGVFEDNSAKMEEVRRNRDAMFAQLAAQQEAACKADFANYAAQIESQRTKQEIANTGRVNAKLRERVDELAAENAKLRQELYSQPWELGRISVDEKDWKIQQKIIKTCWLCRLRFKIWCMEDKKADV